MRIGVDDDELGIDFVMGIGLEGHQPDLFDTAIAAAMVSTAAAMV